MIRLAVDAINLLADRRGMGRFALAGLDTAIERADIALTLLVRRETTRAYRNLLKSDRFALAGLASAATRGRYDVVWYPWNGVRFKSHAPTLVTMHDLFAFEYPARGWIARRREQGPIRRAAREATRIATNSAYTRERVIDFFHLAPANVVSIPHAPDRFFWPGYEAPPVEPPFVLAVGLGEKRKNASFLIDAFARAFPKRDVRLVVAGSIDRRAVKRAKRKGVALVLVSPDDRELRTLYRTATAVAIPSLAEGFGLVAVEAQACGAAVIASNTTALPEAVGEAGLLVDPTNRAAWASALRSVVTDEPLRSWLASKSEQKWGFTSRDGAIASTLDELVNLARTSARAKPTPARR